VDLFHALHPDSLPWHCGCPVLATVADIICEVLPQPGEAGLRRWKNSIRHRLRHLRPTHLISMSETTRDDLQRLMRIPSSRVDVVPLGVETRTFTTQAGADGQPDVRGLGLPDRYFVSVGSDHYRKNQQTLFQAWRQAAASVEEGLVLVGRQIYGDTFDRVCAEAAGAGLGDRVVWLRDLDDRYLPALYRQATALVAPSLYEGFGLTLLEAMASGSPVVASATPAHREVAREAALLFDPLSAHELAGLLVRVSAEEGLRERMRQLGLDRVKRFTWSRCARETLRVYRKMLDLPEPA
jgi:alpha-1,3-rhamnosyl/mannosyltransferase